MSINYRYITLQECDCDYDRKTVHCETDNGQIRCEICGRIKKELN